MVKANVAIVILKFAKRIDLGVEFSVGLHYMKQ